MLPKDILRKILNFKNHLELEDHKKVFRATQELIQERKPQIHHCYHCGRHDDTVEMHGVGILKAKNLVIPKNYCDICYEYLSSLLVTDNQFGQPAHGI